MGQPSRGGSPSGTRSVRGLNYLKTGEFMIKEKLKELHKTSRDYKATKNFIISVIEYLVSSMKLYSGPQIVDAVITKNCNLSCIFCKKYQSRSDNMSLEKFKILASKILPDARKLNICSGGEPFMHKDLILILRVAKEYKVWISVVSNGMLLNQDIANKIVKEELIDELSFSVDGILPETVENIRLNANLSKIVRNIKILLSIKKRSNKVKPIVSIRYALMKKNIEELPDAVEFWGKLAISQIKCNYLSLCDGIDKSQSLYFHNMITEKIFKDATNLAKKFSELSLSLPPLISAEGKLKGKKNPINCRYPWMFVMIDTDGRVFPCYNSWGAIDMGNILSDNIRFKDIWNSQNYLDLRRTVNNESAEKHYSYCSICPSRFGPGTQTLHFGDELFFKELAVDHNKINSIKSFRLNK